MSAPNLTEIEYLISKLEGMESSEDGYILLSALYVCREAMLGQPREPVAAAHSETEIPVSEPLDPYGGSEFLQAVAGKDAAAAWGIMDELMGTLQVVNRRAYDSVIRKLEAL